MKITRLVRNVHNKEKIAIYIDSKYTFSVLESILISESLYVGKELSETELTQLKYLSEYKNNKQRVLNLISIRPRSEKEVRDYLIKKTNEEITEKLIAELQKDGYINDQSFSNWWVDQRKTFTNKSINEIKNELIRKGISKDITQEIRVNDLNKDSEIESAYRLLEKKYRLLSHKKLDKQALEEKFKMYLARKGFSWDVIREALDKITQDK